MKPIPVPPDFAAVAPTLSDAELRRRYGRGYWTIKRWCRLCGVKPKPPEVPPTKRKWKFVNLDTPEQIEMCLNCKHFKCWGTCDEMEEAKRRI